MKTSLATLLPHVFVWSLCGFVLGFEVRSEEVSATLLMLWGLAAVLFATPYGLAAGVLMARAERQERGVRHPRRWLWVPFLTLLAWGAQFLTLVPPVAVVLVRVLWRGRGWDDLFVLGLGSIPFAVFVALAVSVHRYGLSKRSFEGLTPTEVKASPVRISSRTLVAGMIGWTGWVPGLVVLSVARDVAPIGFVLLGWALLGVVGAVVVGSFTARWYKDTTRLASADVSAGIWAIHWLPPYILAIGDGSPGDAEWLMVLSAVIMVVLGTWVWARAKRGIAGYAAG